jgi:hypothetical protein
MTPETDPESPRHIDPPHLVEQIQAALPDLYRFGGRSGDLMATGTAFLNLVLPDDNRLALADRAIQAEAILTAACTALGTPDGDAAKVLLGLRTLIRTSRTSRTSTTAPGALRTTLTARRDHAATLYDIKPGTFRRPRHEGRLTTHLAVEIYRRLRGGQQTTLPLPAPRPGPPPPPPPPHRPRPGAWPGWTPAHPGTTPAVRRTADTTHPLFGPSGPPPPPESFRRGPRTT